MPKDNIFKTLAAVIIGGISAYMRILAVPVFVLLAVMVIDYISGMLKAWSTGELSSKVGLRGLLKKVGYFLTVCAAGVVDWLIGYGIKSIGIRFEISFYFGLIVTIWLIINELISILENLTVLGVPMPSFLTAVVGKLKIAVETKGNSETEE